MSALELLDYAYSVMVDGLDYKQRAHLDAALNGKVDENGGMVVEDPDLPQELQGMTAPSWWDSDHDPMADQHHIDAVI